MSTGTPKNASAIPPAIQAIVSASPPSEIALRTASSKSFHSVKGKARRADAHGRTVAKTVVGSPSPFGSPLEKEPPEPGVGIPIEILVEAIDEVATMQNPVGDGNRQHGVVSKAMMAPEELEVLGFRAHALVDRARNITGNRAEHVLFSQFYVEDLIRETRSYHIQRFPLFPGGGLDNMSVESLIDGANHGTCQFESF
jgi:hypothetical protein